MYKSYFGRNGQVRFSSPNEYYQLLGYLAKSDGTTAITWKNNEDEGHGDRFREPFGNLAHGVWNYVS